MYLTKKIKRLLVKLRHELCKGIYVRTKTSFSSYRDKYRQLNYGYIFQGESLRNETRQGQNTGRFILHDVDGILHSMNEVRPSTKKERKLFYSTVNPARKPLRIL